MNRPPFRRRNRERVRLVLIILLAFALRVYRLDAQALWWDESLSVYRATRDLGAVLANTILIQNVVTIDTLPQLYFVLLHFLVRAFGIGEFALRFFSVAVNVATIPLLYALARRWLAPSAGLIAALLGALSPFYVWYAQEARPYALVLFWSTLAVYALTRAFGVGRGRARINAAEDRSIRARPRSSASYLWLGVYFLAAIASLYTHYYAVFLFPFHAVLIAVLVWQVPRARAFILLPALPLATVFFLLPQIGASAAGNVDTGPSFVPLLVILRDLLNSFSVGVTVDLAQVWGIDAALGMLFLIGIAFSNSKSCPEQSRRIKMQNSMGRLGIWDFEFGILILAYLAIPIVCVQVLSYLRPLYQNSRYLIALSPAFYLGVAAGVVALARWAKPLALVALAVFLAGAALSLNNLYFEPRWGKDDHRAWAEYLRERAQPGDFLILDSPHTEELYRYYADDWLPMTTLPILRADGAESPDADLAAVRDAYRQRARVWFLEMHVPFDDPDARIEKLLNQEGVLLDQANFAGTSTEISLALFARTLPVAQPTDIRYPLDIAFAGHLHLKGYDAPLTASPGKRVVVRLYWQIDEPVGEDYAVSLRLVDQAGTFVGQWDAIPPGNRAGSSTWRAGAIIVDAHDLPISAAARPGNHRLQVVPYHSATGTALGDVVTLGELEILNLAPAR